MRAYLSAMHLLPPESRAETPAQMEATRQESAIDRLIQQRHERHLASAEQQRADDQMSRIAATPVTNRQALEIDWDALTLCFPPTIKNKPKIPEAKQMNGMSYTIHRYLTECIKDNRGKNALMAFDIIIRERLIAKSCCDNGTYDGLVAYTVRKGKFETMKLGRFIKRHILKEEILPENVFQKCIERLVDYFFPTVEFEIHSGDKITQNYANRVGGGSCMAGEHSPKVDMYARNPKKFSQLIGKQNNTTARAIVFHMDDGFNMLGRIYTGSAHLNNMMKQYAKKKGWVYYDGYDLYLKGEVINRSDFDLVVSGVAWKEGGVPYMDDFENATIENDNTLTLYWSSGGDYNLTDCSGMLRDGVFCINCDMGFDENDAYNDDDGYWCPECFEQYFVTCDECEETTHINDICEVNNGNVCGNCHDNYYVTCVECESDHHAEDTVTLYDGEEVCKPCLEANYTLCEECEQYVKETTCGEDDRELCESCKENCYAETE